jgi:hypothetical protein
MEVDPRLNVMPDSVFEAYVAVHKEDQALCDEVGAVRRRHYAATHKTYIGLRKNESDAIERAVTLFGNKCAVHKGSFLLLRVQFSSEGFAKYATAMHGPDDSFVPTLYKIVYPRDNSGTDYNAWAFHGDLPLQETAEDGSVLISSKWMEIA